ncbi:Uncharacterised protein [Mycobacterium tuberculosis]|nr:Uncharacterised protein [Mycobacterium tuberculosis]
MVRPSPRNMARSVPPKPTRPTPIGMTLMAAVGLNHTSVVSPASPPKAGTSTRPRLDRQTLSTNRSSTKGRSS